MHAAVFHGPYNLTNDEVNYNDLSDKKEDGTLLRVNACAVCGYDVRVFRNGHKKVIPPIILGHEICGQIIRDVVTISDNGTTQVLKAGSRVAVSPLIPCLNCRYCSNKQYNLCLHLKEIGSNINGGFAEFVRIPEQNIKVGGLVSVPDNLSDDEAALLEPLACCMNGFYHIGLNTKEPEKDNSVVAIIGDGPIGLLHLQLSKKLYNAETVVVGKIAHRIQKAKSMGADTTVLLSNDRVDDCVGSSNVTEHDLDLINGIGADVIIIATSDPSALDFAKKIAVKNSRINLFAGMSLNNFISFDPNWLHYNQISITGSFSSTPEMLQQAARLASNGEIDLSKIITHRYALTDIKQAILATGEYHGLRVIINKF